MCRLCTEVDLGACLECKLWTVVLQVLQMRLQMLMLKAVKAPQCRHTQNMRASLIHQLVGCPSHLLTSPSLHLQPQGRSL